MIFIRLKKKALYKCTPGSSLHIKYETKRMKIHPIIPLFYSPFCIKIWHGQSCVLEIALLVLTLLDLKRTVNFTLRLRRWKEKAPVFKGSAALLDTDIQF